MSRAATNAHRLFFASLVLICTPPLLYAGERLNQKTALRIKRLIDSAGIVQDNLERLFGTRFKKAVTVKVITRKRATEIMRREMDRETPPQEIRFTRDAFVRFGLFPEGFDLRRTFIKMLSEQVGGFYIPRRKTLYLILGVPLQSVITAHELTHALQDQLFDLKHLIDNCRHDDDRALALQSVFEGEAVLSMGVYLHQYTGRWEAISGTLQSVFSSSGQMQSLNTAPAFLVKRLLFPYQEGNQFVSIAFRTGGWRGIHKLFRDLPQSSEQILHPEKYFEHRDRPTIISLKEVDPALGADWKRLGQNTLGEFGVRMLLQTLSHKALDSMVAANGWDGDRFLLFSATASPARKSACKEQALVWLSTWDSEAHALRFFDSYRKAISRHLDQPAKNVSPQKYRWTGAGRQDILLSRWGKEILLLDGFAVDERRRIRNLLSNLKRSGKLFVKDNRSDASTQ